MASRLARAAIAPQAIASRWHAARWANLETHLAECKHGELRLPKPGDVFDVKRIRRLVELMNEHDLSEIDLREGEQRIRLRAGAEPRRDDGASRAAAAAPAAATGAAASTAAAAAAAADEKLARASRARWSARSTPRPVPRRRRSSRSATTSGPRPTVCIIEAMKVFNEIPAEVSGKIVGRAGRERRAGRVRPAAVQGRTARNAAQLAAAVRHAQRNG